MRRRLGIVVLVPAAAALIVGALGLLPEAAAAGSGPISVTPYQGFNAALARAPYVTDLTPTSAEGTWATTLSPPDTISWRGVAVCTADTATVPSTQPLSYPAAGALASVTAREFNVGSISEYQSSVELTGLAPSTTYCYRVYGPGRRR